MFFLDVFIKWSAIFPMFQAHVPESCSAANLSSSISDATVTHSKDDTQAAIQGISFSKGQDALLWGMAIF
ncbi:hypothetical protein ACI2KO_02565 [Pseudomonas piscis]|uniref:hypothetical protein n=1 Tax=Pseudomonas piscis TaxID=2614538 RepID=UPI00385018B1